jgi:argonaute-like protein implicated in RNA metabolism and viral defense
MFRVALNNEMITHHSFQANLTDPESVGAAYRCAVEEWAAAPRERAPALAFVVVPRSNRWEVERPYYEAKAALASMGIPSQMVTTELLSDEPRFGWAAANIALASFAKLGGIPWAVEAPAGDSDLIIGVGRQEVGPQGDRTRTFGYAVTFVSNGLYRHTWSMTPAANDEAYVRRLSEAVKGALTDDVRDLDEPPKRVIVHLAKKARREEIDAVQQAMVDAGMTLPVAFLRLDDSALWDLADDRQDTWSAARGTVVRLDDRHALLQTEGVTNTGAPGGPLLIGLDARSTVGPEHLDDLVGQVFRLAHANWRTFTGRSKPATILYGEQLAALVGHMSRLGTWSPHTLPIELKNRPWFL